MVFPRFYYLVVLGCRLVPHLEGKDKVFLQKLSIFTRDFQLE